MAMGAEGTSPNVSATCTDVSIESSGRVVASVVLDDGEGYYSFISNHDDMGDARSILYEFEGFATSIVLASDGSVNVVDTDGNVHSDRTGSWQLTSITQARLSWLNEVDGTLVACGAQGGTFRLLGGTWQPLVGPSKLEFFGLDGDHIDDLYIVGRRGTAARIDHGTWFELALPTNADLLSVHAAAAGDVLIGGKRGTLLRGASAQWQAIDIDDLSVYAITTFNGKIYIGCADRGLWRLKNGSVELVRDDVPAFRLASAGNYLAVGGRNKLWRFDGQRWEDRTYRHGG